MDIISYLEEILLQSKEVSVAGLGTLYKNKFPGKYDKEKQAFLPPGFTLKFTSEVKNDGILANHIAEKRNISQESAQYYIDQFVEETNKKLELAHEAILPNIGRFFYTEHEGLSFEPSKNVNFGSEFFGLPVLPEIHEEEIDITPKTQIVSSEEAVFEEIDEAPTENTYSNQPIVEPNIENIELDEVKDDLKNTLQHVDTTAEEVTEAPDFIKEQHEEHPNRFGHQPDGEQDAEKTYVNLEEDKQETLPVSDAPEFIKEQHEEHPNRFGNDPMVGPDSEQSKSIWPKILIIITSLLIIGALVYFLKPDLFNKPVQEKPNVAVIPDSTTLKPDTAKIKQDSIAKADSVLKVNLVQNSVDTPKINNAVTKTGEITFEVIGVSFEKIEKANKYIKAVKTLGINAKIVKMPGKRQNISVGSFKTQKEAEDNLTILQKKLDGKGFYVQQIINTQP